MSAAEPFFSCNIELMAPDMTASIEKTPAAIGAVPYAAIKLSWFAFSKDTFGTRFGTDASFAGDQKSETISTKINAVYSQIKFPTTGIEKYNPNLRMSQKTISFLRSNLSAITPAIGPKITAGMSRTIKTPAIAKFAFE